ncbi:high-affinity branched-chain amino acid ABC transporter permease LivM [Methylovirgula sp. 4M-Z18]|nr:high-affinity branched-chain amino acid ABC transporter permease LivM [Methylovirgula sp. 4M-Z18]
MLHAIEDISNQMILEYRWSLGPFAALMIFALIFVGSLLSGITRAVAIVAMLYVAWLIGWAWFGETNAISVTSVKWFVILLVAVAGITWFVQTSETTGTSPAAQAGQVLNPIKPLIPFVGFGLAIAFPFLVLVIRGPGEIGKWVGTYGILVMIYIMLGWGLNIVVGLAGLLDLGYVAFYAVGAYSYSLLSTTYGLSFWICLPVAGCLAAFWGIILGFPVLRLRGDYLAIVTLAFGEIIRVVIINWSDLTNGYAGISGIPKVTFFGLPFSRGEGSFESTFGLDGSQLANHRTIFLYFLILGLALITNFVTLRLRKLPIGRAWEALREDEIACRSLGINTTNTKLTAFALGAMFGGFGGSFFAVKQGFVSPESFTFIESATILAVVVLGGMGSQAGVALAALFMIGGTEYLRELDWTKDVFGPNFDPTQYRMLLFGLGMVVMMLWRPRGLIGTREPSIFLKEKKAVSGSLVQEGHG